jgi:hypothetical protein
MENEVLGLVKDGPNILSTIYSDLAQPSVKKVGFALETVFEFSTSFLLPLKLRNEKVRMNFEKNLNNYKEKIKSVPDNELCDVNPQIGTPIIEKLTYTTNEEIADLFTTLLKKASVTSTINEAHPAFVQIIERLSVDEARLVKSLTGKHQLPSITFRANIIDGGHNDIVKNATMLIFENITFPENTAMYVSNLVSSGILKEGQYGVISLDEETYTLLTKAYNYESYLDAFINITNFKDLEIIKGVFEITEFGKAFIKACIE